MDAMNGAPERKDHRPAEGLVLREGRVIEGYASLFGQRDQGGDVVLKGAYAASLKRLAAGGRAVKMLWQHDPAQPIGIWDEVREDIRADLRPGDMLRFTAGCDKRAETCRMKFANMPNFRGFPHIPGEDWLTAYPRAGRNTGGGSIFAGTGLE